MYVRRRQVARCGGSWLVFLERGSIIVLATLYSMKYTYKNVLTSKHEIWLVQFLQPWYNDISLSPGSLHRLLLIRWGTLIIETSICRNWCHSQDKMGFPPSFWPTVSDQTLDGGKVYKLDYYMYKSCNPHNYVVHTAMKLVSTVGYNV